MRSYVVAVFAVFAVTSSSCACGTGPSLICAYATPIATGWKKVNGPLPADGSGGPNVQIDTTTWFVQGGQTFNAPLSFSGGPIATVRIGVEGECYFEIPVHPERASQSTFNDIESDVAGDIAIAKTAAMPSGQFKVEFDYSRLGAPSLLRIAGLEGQLVDTSGRVSQRASIGSLTICQADGQCDDTPPATGGGSASGGGAGGGGAGGGAGGGGTGMADAGPPLQWSDWVFLRSDQPTQYRVALTRTSGSRYFYKTEFRVNRADPVFVAACNGYIGRLEPNHDPNNAPVFSVTFSGTSMNSVVVPTEFAIDLIAGQSWRPGGWPTVDSTGFTFGLNQIYPVSAGSCCRADANCGPASINFNGP